MNQKQPILQGDVIVLLGTSTAGKSSIIKALINPEPERKELGLDLTTRREAVNYIENSYTEDFSFIQADAVLILPDNSYRLPHGQRVPKVSYIIRYF